MARLENLLAELTSNLSVQSKKVCSDFSSVFMEFWFGISNANLILIAFKYLVVGPYLLWVPLRFKECLGKPRKTFPWCKQKTSQQMTLENCAWVLKIVGWTVCCRFDAQQFPSTKMSTNVEWDIQAGSFRDDDWLFGVTWLHPTGPGGLMGESEEDSLAMAGVSQRIKRK